MGEPERGISRAHAEPHCRVRDHRQSDRSEIQTEPEPYQRRAGKCDQVAERIGRQHSFRHGTVDERTRPGKEVRLTKMWSGHSCPLTLTMSKRKKSPTSQPLSGVRVLVGRARHQAGALSTELRKLGADVSEIPFIEIRKPKSFKP